MGIRETLKILDGMFAFVYSSAKKIVFFWGKFGEKPLYYGFNKTNFIWFRFKFFKIS